jgi:hypothetical protein
MKHLSQSSKRLTPFVIGASLFALCATSMATFGAESQASAQRVGSVVSLLSSNYPDRAIRHRSYLGEITPISSNLDRQDSSFRVVRGLAGRGISFESINFPGHYLRHQSYRIRLAPSENTPLYRNDATFTPRHGLSGVPGEVSYESVNYPGHYIRHCSFHLYIDNNSRGNQDCNATPNVFQADTSFTIVPAR